MIIDLDKITLSPEVLDKISKNREHNRVIANYYNVYADKEKDIDFMKRGTRVHYCNKYWEVDWYITQKIKDYKKTYLCMDKFCMNCKKLKQAVKIARFKPELEKYDNLYHMVLTVPNVDGASLKYEIKRMFKAFKRLICYLNGNDSIVGVDFSKWNYKGALRSLEVTYKPWGNYHHHMHVIIKLDGFNPAEYIDTMRVQNTYSVKNGVITKLFSPEEILLQKVWKLLINDDRVTKDNINSMELGYSCILEPIKDDDYFEIFKYLTKGDGKDQSPDSENYYMSYRNFEDLWRSLYRVRQIQGYGCFYNLKIDDSEEEALIEEMDISYDEMIAELQKIEKPVYSRETIQTLQMDTVNKVISRKRYLEYLRELYNRDDE